MRKRPGPQTLFPVKIQLGFREETAQRLNNLAKQKRIWMTVLIRQIIDDYFEQLDDKRHQNSGYDPNA